MPIQGTISRILDDAVEQFATLPGVGRRTAMRLALNMLSRDGAEVSRFASAIVRLKDEVRFCPDCHLIADDGICPVCSDGRRDHTSVCVVESLRDVLSIENTGSYNGLYHVLGGLISPLDGIGPADLPIESLVGRIGQKGIEEVIFALSTGMEGETTAFYLYKKLSPLPVRITALVRGVGFGDDLEYADEVTLGRSIAGRQPFKP